jgi:transcriptional regulator with XRE-family HTH domain
VTAIEFRDCLAQLGLTQTETARLLEVDPRTVRRWAEGNDIDIPGPAEHALRAWLGLQRRGLPWRPGDDDAAEQIAPHRAHAIELYELLLRVDKRGGPSGAWKVDLEKGQATLGPMKVSFYKLANGGFSPSFYNRTDGRSDLKRDWALIEDAFACIAKAFAEQRRIKFVFAVTLQNDNVLLWDVQKVPTIVVKVPCSLIRKTLCRGTEVTDEQCRLLINCNESLICELAEAMYAANRFEIREDKIRVLEVKASDLATITDRFSLTVLNITPIWVEGAVNRKTQRRGGTRS